MKKLEFLMLCGKYMIAPDIVLENQSIADALADRDDDRVKQLMETEF